MNWRKPLFNILSFLQGSKRMKYYNEILEIDSQSIEKKREYQEEKLKRTLLHAYDNVPYYTKVLEESGVVKGGEVFLDEFENIPVLTKEILKEEYENLKSSDIAIRKGYKNHSGGSSGQPTEFMQDPEYFDWGMGGRFYMDYLAGQEIGQKVLRLWGSERDLLGQKDPFIRRVKYFFFNRRDINAFKLSQEDLQNHFEAINEYRPHMIEAYVNVMYELACYIELNNLEVFSPELIITSAGTLYPDMKEKIEKVFDTKVWNRYGSREVGAIAMGRDKLLMAYWHNYVEVVDKNTFKGTKDVGKVLVTTLDNFSMPLIRYDIGDLAQMSDEWPYLDSVQGREMASFYNREGKIIPGILFVHFLGVVLNEGYIQKFQIIQKDYEEIEVKAVAAVEESELEENKKDVEKLINDVMECDCNITWTFVEDIPNLKSGKYLYVKSELKR